MIRWYPEWKLDLGAAKQTASTVADLASAGLYRRDFDKGAVLVNPSDNAVTVQLGAPMNRVVPQGGGPVDASGAEPGTITTQSVTTVAVPAKGVEILLN